MICVISVLLKMHIIVLIMSHLTQWGCETSGNVAITQHHLSSCMLLLLNPCCLYISAAVSPASTKVDPNGKRRESAMWPTQQQQSPTKPKQMPSNSHVHRTQLYVCTKLICFNVTTDVLKQYFRLCENHTKHAEKHLT